MDYFRISGGYDGSDARDNILEYDPENREWTQVGTMREAKYGPAVSVVDYEDYATWCL